jgi:hypothetical protein
MISLRIPKEPGSARFKTNTVTRVMCLLCALSNGNVLKPIFLKDDDSWAQPAQSSTITRPSGLRTSYAENGLICLGSFAIAVQASLVQATAVCFPKQFGLAHK